MKKGGSQGLRGADVAARQQASEASVDPRWCLRGAYVVYWALEHSGPEYRDRERGIWSRMGIKI